MSFLQSSTALQSTHNLVSSSRRLRVSHGAARVVMRKADTHPQYFNEAKVYCKGEHVLTVSGTQDEYHVEIWSGNHPFYQGSKTAAPVDDGPLSRFNEKYAGLEDLMEIPTLNSEEAEGLDAFKRKPKKSKN